MILLTFVLRKVQLKLIKKLYTVLLAPMKGFYTNSNIGKTQVRLSLVEDPFLLSLTPEIIASLFKSYSKKISFYCRRDLPIYIKVFL